MSLGFYPPDRCPILVPLEFRQRCQSEHSAAQPARPRHLDIHRVIFARHLVLKRDSSRSSSRNSAAVRHGRKSVCVPAPCGIVRPARREAPQAKLALDLRRILARSAASLPFGPAVDRCDRRQINTPCVAV